MDSILLAQRDFDRWIEIMMMILVIGGSMLAAMSKKLIKFFGSKEPGKTGGVAHRPRTNAGKVLRQPPARHDIQPVRPIARTLPPRTARQEVQTRPIAQAYPPSPAPPKYARATSPQRVAPPRLAAAIPQAQASPPPRRRKPAAAHREDRLGHLEPTVHSHLGHLHSAVEDRAASFDTTVDENLGHLQPTVEPSTLTVPEQSRPGARWDKVADPVTYRDRQGAALLRAGGLVGRLTPGDLRHAVLMREILGPPVSLHPPDEPF